DATLRNMKQSILDGFPVIFGFPIHESITSMTGPDYVVPPPQSEHDKRLGGHAVLTVGFDDEVAVPSSSLPNFTEDDKRGALIFRNSWGPDWGCGGYACLPYYYVRHCLAIDCWTILQTDWLNLEVFD